MLRVAPAILVALAALATLAAAAPAAAQDPVPPDATVDLSVEESVRRAVERDARIRRAAAETAEARARLGGARAERLPSLEFQGSYTRLGEVPPVEFSLPGLDTTFTAFPVERDRYNFEVGVEQPLFTGFRLSEEVTAARRQAEAAELLEQEERAAVAFETRRAYWTLYHALSLREAVETALAQVDEHLQNVGQQVDEGAALRADLLRARTRRAEVLVDRVEATNAIRLARLELNQWVGQPPAADVRLSDDPPSEAPEQTLEAFVASVQDAHPRLQALRLQVLALEAATRAAGADRLPSLGVFGRYVYARPNPYYMSEPGEFHGTWELGLSTRWSLWDAGRRTARTREAQARVDAARARMDDAARQVEVEATRRYLETRRATEALDAAALLLDEARETLRVVRLQYQEGAALAEQVLDAERATYAARAQLARARADLAIARAGMLAVAGRVR